MALISAEHDHFVAESAELPAEETFVESLGAFEVGSIEFDVANGVH
jgi:hypothetical protein